MNNKNERDYYNIWEKFIGKFFIGMILLVTVTLLDKLSIVSFDSIKSELSENINILKIIKSVNGTISFIPIDATETINVSSNSYSKIKKVDDKYRISLGNYEAVENYKDGIIIRKYQNEDGNIQITILGLDDIEYTYSGLTNCDLPIYKFLKSGEIIGKATNNNNENYFYIEGRNGLNKINLFD